MYTNENGDVKVGKVVWHIALVLVVLILYAVFVSPIVTRYQARQDAVNAIKVQEQGRLQARLNAENEASINEIKIKQQEQLIQVEKQKAEIRVQEALGIAKAQEIINATLTDK